MTVNVEATPKLDRRQRKSRAALDTALLQLIAERPYAEVTVEDIVNTADVARATFYAHYRDKDDLLAAANQRLIDGLMATVADVSWQRPPTYTGVGVLTILRHVDAHRDLYRVIISGEGGPAARDTLVTTFRNTATAVFVPGAEKQGKSPRLDPRLITTAFVGALLLTIEDWLAGHLDEGPDDLAVKFMQSQAGGLEWSLGFQPGDLIYTPEPL
jgi:AcrR family transcriptional regulator